MGRRHARRPDVEELADALPGDPGDGLGQELPVITRQFCHERVDAKQPLTECTVSLEVVLAAESVIAHMWVAAGYECAYRGSIAGDEQKS
jgi:hypothetical protein